MSNAAALPDIRQTELLNAPIQKVWNAVATSEGIAAWFMPNTFEPVMGNEFVLKAGPWGDSPCKVTELDPPNKLSFTWGREWVLTFELEELDGGTQFTLIHSGWKVDQLTEFGESHAVVRERMSQGWSGIGQRLRKLIEG